MKISKEPEDFNFHFLIELLPLRLQRSLQKLVPNGVQARLLLKSHTNPKDGSVTPSLFKSTTAEPNLVQTLRSAFPSIPTLVSQE